MYVSLFADLAWTERLPEFNDDGKLLRIALSVFTHGFAH